MADQITINVTENKQVTVENVLDSLKITDAAPTTRGLYRLSEIGTYTNLGGLVTTAGKINDAYFDGTYWKLIAVNVDSSILAQFDLKQDKIPTDRFSPELKKTYTNYSLPNCVVNGNIASVTPNWANVASGNYKSLIIPIKALEKFTIIWQKISYYRYAFLTNDTIVEGSPANLAGGATAVSVSSTRCINVTAPSDANYLLVSVTDSGSEIYLPTILGASFFNQVKLNLKCNFTGGIFPEMSVSGTSVILKQNIAGNLKVFDDKHGELKTVAVSAGTTWTIPSGSILYYDILDDQIKISDNSLYDNNGGHRAIICYCVNGFIYYGMSQLFMSKLLTSEIEKLKKRNSNWSVINGNISASNVWENVNNTPITGTMFLIPVKKYRIYKLNSSSSTNKKVSFLKSYNQTLVFNGATPDYATGYTGVVSFNNNDEVVAPSDANYMVISSSSIVDEPFYDISVEMTEEEQYRNIGKKFQYIKGNVASDGLFKNTTTDTYRSIIFEVTAGEKLKLYSSFSIKRITFLTNDTLTEGIAPSLADGLNFTTFYNGVTYTVPSGAKYAMVYVRSTAGVEPQYPFVNVLSDTDNKLNLVSKKDFANNKKTIAVFGGSFSSIAESQFAKQIWQKILNAEKVDTWGVEGSGFARNTHHATESQVAGTAPFTLTKWTWTDDSSVVHTGDVSIQGQVNQATANAIEPYDIYILWASTNDFSTYPAQIGTRNSYTASDSFADASLDTQNGGINYCIKKILQKNPLAKIYFFGSARFFAANYGNDSEDTTTNALGFKFMDYINGQIACCEKFSIPYLNQWSIASINSYNYTNYYQGDNLHLNQKGYEFYGSIQAEFLKNGK